MRRKDKEITDRALMDSIISHAQVCHIGLCDEGRPYVVPMCFGYDGTTIYLHGAREGRKIEILKRSPDVCFEFDTDCEIKKGDKSCSFTMKYRSVMGYGRASFVEEPEARGKALNLIMNQYEKGSFSFPEESLAKIAIIAIHVTEMTSKKSGY